MKTFDDRKWMTVVWLVGLSAGMIIGVVGMVGKNGMFAGGWKRKTDSVEVVKYWYVQMSENYGDRILHVDRKCGAMLKSKVVVRKRIGSDVGSVYLCPVCVDDERYDRMMKMMEVEEDD